MFSLLVTPVVAEAVQRARELASESDEVGFHQLRVAFRKLRALYWAYSPYLGEEATVHATEEFKRLAAVAGGTLDWDIAGELLRNAQESGVSLGPLMVAVREKRAQAVILSQQMINSDEVEAFLHDTLVRGKAFCSPTVTNFPYGFLQKNAFGSRGVHFRSAVDVPRATRQFTKRIYTMSVRLARG